MAFRRWGRVLLVRQGKESANEDEWRGFLQLLDGQDLESLRVLVVTDGGGPTSAQRSQLRTMMAGRSARTAVVSDSIKVRFVIASIALINREHYGFANRELSKAYEFLEFTPSEQAHAAIAIGQMAELIA